MGIGSITSTNSMPVMQMTPADLKDQKSKNIQNEITETQQQMQKLSSQEDLSAAERADEKKKLQKEITDLDTELKRHQDELRQSKKRELMIAELRESQDPAKKKEAENGIQAAGKAAEDDPRTKNAFSGQTDEKTASADGQQAARPGTVIAQADDDIVILKEAVNQPNSQNADTEKEQADETEEEAVTGNEAEAADVETVTDTGLSGKEIHAMVSADVSLEQSDRLGTIIARTSDGIAILKGEINQDEKRDVNTERKQAELERMEKQEQRAMAFQFSILGEAANKTESEAAVSAKDKQADIADNAYFNALRVSQEDQASQQRFYVSFG